MAYKSYFISPFFYFNIDWKDQEDKGIFEFLNMLIVEKKKVKKGRKYFLFKQLYHVYNKMYGIKVEDFNDLCLIISSNLLNRFYDYVDVSKIKNMRLKLFQKEISVIVDGKEKKGILDGIFKKMGVAK